MISKLGKRSIYQYMDSRTLRRSRLRLRDVSAVWSTGCAAEVALKIGPLK